MSTLESQLAAAQDRERAAASRRLAARRGLDGLIGTAREQGRATFTAGESALADRYLGERDQARRELTTAQEQVRELARMQAEEDTYQAATRVSTPGARPLPPERGVPYDRAARVGYEARTYRPDEDPNGRGFLLDVARNFMHADPGAAGRLSRHMAEERVERPGFTDRAAGDATTGNWAGLTVPQYLIDMYAPAAAALQPLVDQSNQHPLPAQGLALDISEITTPSSAALQANELDAVSATSMDDTLLTVPVLTAAGMQKVSRQAIERGAGIEDVTMQDLVNRVATVMDSTLITRAATGVSATAQPVTYTSASPTAAEFWPYIFQAHSKLEGTLLAQAPVNAVVMHPRRWNWLCAQVGTSWPFLGGPTSGPVDAQQGGIILTNEYGPAVRGRLSNGDKVIVDANVPTATGGSQDEVYVCALNEIHTWLDPAAPVMIRADQPAAPNLGVLLVAYSYFAFASRYQNNPAKITGTGLAAPAGF